MTIKDLQELISAWEYKHSVPGSNEVTKIELICGKVNKLGKTGTRAGDYSETERMQERCELREGITDVIWDIVSLANELGIDLTESVIDHLEQRNRL